MQENQGTRPQELWMQLLLQPSELVSTLFENTFRAAMDITGLPVAEVTRLRHETHLRVEALADSIDIGYRAGDEFATTDLLAGRVLEKRDGIVIPDLTQTPLARHPSALRFGIRSYIATPLLLRDQQSYGVLSLCSRSPHPLKSDQLLRLSLLGKWLAQEIELRQLHRELDSKNKRISILSQELQRLHTQVEQGSIRDPITDLINSRFFNKLLQTESARARRHAYPLSLILLHPDNFSTLTRQWGTETTNTILSSIGVLLRRHLRTIDNAARYTEDIFAILLPQTDINGAKIVAERIHNTILTHQFSSTSQQNLLPITVSIGLASLDPLEDDPATGILSRSRRAVEQARNAGGNRIIIPQIMGAS